MPWSGLPNSDCSAPPYAIHRAWPVRSYVRTTISYPRLASMGTDPFTNQVTGSL